MRQQGLPRACSADSAKYVVHFWSFGVTREGSVERILNALQQLLGVSEGVFTAQAAVNGQIGRVDE